MPATTEDLMAFLAKLGIATTTRTHAPLFTVEQSQSLRGEIPGAHTKNLFLKDKKDRLFLVVTLEDADLDLKHIHGLIGASGRVSFGKPELLMEVLGVPPGAVTPFGLINDTTSRVMSIFDARLMANDPLNFHPLINTATTTIPRDGLLAFVRATGHEPRILELGASPAAEL